MHMGIRTWLPMAFTATFAASMTAAIGVTFVLPDSTSSALRQGNAAKTTNTAHTAKPQHQNTTTPQSPLIPAPAARAFPDEGVWHPLTTTPDGDPLVQTTALRSDGSTATVVWIHQSAVRFELHPGYNQPGGGAWSQPDTVPPGSRAGLVATWNGGFLMRDSGGGFYLDGKQSGSLIPGVASEIFRRDGSMTVGIWGRDATMGPDIRGVRQQRRLLVDAGRIAPDIDDLGTWGATDAGATRVRRSGVGVTARGDVVYVIGRTMSPRSLATALQQAGAVRAMQLDINVSWPSFMAYDGTQNPSDPRPFKVGDFPRAAERYYSPSARDFVAVYARAASGAANVGSTDVGSTNANVADTNAKADPGQATDPSKAIDPGQATNPGKAADATTPTITTPTATTPTPEVACTTTTENPRNPRQPPAARRVAC